MKINVICTVDTGFIGIFLMDEKLQSTEPYEVNLEERNVKLIQS